MSFDVNITVPEHDDPCPHCGEVVRRVPEAEFATWDPTRNYMPMFRAALGTKEGIYGWNGKTVAEVTPLLRGMIEVMLADPGKFIALEPPNKFGTYADVVPFLRDEVLKTFEKAPPFAVVTVR